jgi:hypothetical protein
LAKMWNLCGISFKIFNKYISNTHKISKNGQKLNAKLQEITRIMRKKGTPFCYAPRIYHDKW